MNPFERIDMLIGYAGIMEDNLFINQLQTLKKEIMSFVNPGTSVPSPAEKKFEYKAREKSFVYYDKEKRENVAMDLKAYLVILETYSCIYGYSKKFNCGGYSNEVLTFDLKKEPLTVRTFKGGYEKIGLYHDIEAKVNKETQGLKLHKSIYAILVAEGKHELINIKVSGSTMGEWIEHVDKEIDTDKNVLVISDEFLEKEDNDGKKYYVPKFDSKPITDELVTVAIEKAGVLNKYFNELKGISEDTVDNSKGTGTPPLPEPEAEGLPF